MLDDDPGEEWRAKRTVVQFTRWEKKKKKKEKKKKKKAFGDQ